MMSTRTGVRALVMVTLCYGALEIVGLLLLLLMAAYGTILLRHPHPQRLYKKGCTRHGVLQFLFVFFC